MIQMKIIMGKIDNRLDIAEKKCTYCISYIFVAVAFTLCLLFISGLHFVTE